MSTVYDTYGAADDGGAADVEREGAAKVGIGFGFGLVMVKIPFC
jgi:hypothetical protein